MTPRTSILVPVYNAAKYLEETLASVRAQTDPDWECVCVDDGSSDASPEILARAAAADARIVVVRQANAGPSAARNAALERARGDWFMFMDADDRLHPGALAALQAVAAAEPGVDVVTGGYTDRPDALSASGAVAVSPDPVARMRDDPAWRGMPWGRLMRTDRFRGVRFALRYHEDVAWLTEATLLARREAVLDAPLYWYRPAPESFSRRPDYEAALPELWRHQARVCPALRPRLGEIVYSWLVKRHDDADGRACARRLVAEGVVTFARLPWTKRLKLRLRGIPTGVRA